jgi:hypothetical protein
MVLLRARPTDKTEFSISNLAVVASALVAFKRCCRASVDRLAERAAAPAGRRPATGCLIEKAIPLAKPRNFVSEPGQHIITRAAAGQAGRVVGS